MKEYWENTREKWYVGNSNAFSVLEVLQCPCYIQLLVSKIGFDIYI